jgi:NAD(P)-dependent dehydrogenase (short-subunit alcohol dehydrogenase family)
LSRAFTLNNALKGKTIVLAGGAGGLGAAVAESLCEEGAMPVIGYLRNRERAESFVGRLSEKYGIAVPAVAGDILDASVRQRLIEAAGKAGELYGLVPLVGNPARVPIETATEQHLIESMRANFIGPLLLARDFAAAVGEQDAAVVFVSTMQAIGVFPGSTTYAAPKAALVHTARILAKQWKIRVNVVAPGANNAGMAEQSVRSGKYDSFLEKKIIPRFGRPADVARAVLFFLEPDNYLTGQVLTVDGGLSLKM